MTIAQTKIHAYSEKEQIGHKRGVVILRTFCIAVLLSINSSIPQRHKTHLSSLFHLTVCLTAAPLLVSEQ